MKIEITTVLLALTALSGAIPLDVAQQQDAQLIDTRTPETSSSDLNDLFKRKGGGGGGGRGGGGTSSGGGTTSGGGSTSSGGAGTRPAGSSTSSSGGRSAGGTGVTPNYGGRYYSGGASVPYTAGGRSPLGLAPVFLPVAALAIFPGLWLYGAYSYGYSRPYTYYNSTSNQNETKPVECLCARYSVCGCDDNTNSTFMNDLIGNGSTADLDDTVRVGDYNGKSTILVNGTLDNGTTADDGTTAGSTGTTSSSGTGTTGTNAGSKDMQSFLEVTGYWVMAVTVAATVMMV